MELTIGKGRGYVQANDNVRTDAPIGTISLDSIFTPIRNVKYSIENFRVEQRIDYEKLIIELDCDGSITPKDALQEVCEDFDSALHACLSDERISLGIRGAS